MDTATVPNRNGLEVAIIGMAGRFPGAKDTEEFWQNLRDATCSVSTFTDEELIASGIDAAVLKDPNYVKAGALLEDVKLFDAPFFGFNPRDAEVIDPQQRVFLECSWEALEDAGYNSQSYEGLIGVYAGVGINSYAFNILSNEAIQNSIDDYQLFVANDKDFLTTRVSYHLGFEGPSIDIQTACSTSLVAVHIACRSLLSGECDIALAGGVAIKKFRKEGYFYQQGGILSSDGYCRAFDAEAQGTVAGDGVGIVVLKRLEEAIADGDCIHAVIKGSAINNDGAFKVGYTAPRIDTQAAVIRSAQAIADVEPDTITYIETHGTGTSLGDPIEISALRQAFGGSQDQGYCCAIGSVKTNIGHLDVAAGIAGLIKTVLALKHEKIPPSLHCKQPNPKIDFDNSPFYVNTSLSDWNKNSISRRAGVSSFGIGGTNAHVIIEEAPPLETSSSSRPWQLLLLSAKTPSALGKMRTNLVTHLKQFSSLNLADLAYTLQVGRQTFEHRQILLCQNIGDAIEILETENTQQLLTRFQEPCKRQIVFMFPGQGSQYVDMGRGLYETEAIFRKTIDECCEILKPYIDLDLRTILYPQKKQLEASQQLRQTYITQPALFIIEYALAQLWIAWGLSPTAMIGHSIGEYVAATLAGVFSLEDALKLVAERGKLMQKLPSGEMLSVQLSKEEVQPWLNEELSLAAINAPSLCVVSGSKEAITNLQGCLEQKGIECRQLHTSHAFHSQVMDSILEPFTNFVANIELNSPQLPFISNLTGTWITVESATDAGYWADQLRGTVDFAAGMKGLLQQPDQILLEVGPGRTLSTFAKQQTQDLMVLSSIRHPKDNQSDIAFLLNTLGQLWLLGVQIDWAGFYTQEKRRRTPLPTYPFERQRYWIERKSEIASSVAKSQELPHRKPNMADWFYIPSWEKEVFYEPINDQGKEAENPCWLIFVDAYGLGSQLAKQLEQEGENLVTVSLGEQFTQLNLHSYSINPQKQDDYDTLLQTLCSQKLAPNLVTHLWSVTSDTNSCNHSPVECAQSIISNFEGSQSLGFYSLLFLVQAIGRQNITEPIKINVVTNKVQDVVGEEEIHPEKATILGPCKVIPQEYPNITCRSIDVILPESGTQQMDRLVMQVVAEGKVLPNNPVVAYRGGNRWVQTFKAVHLNESIKERSRLRQGGVYLIVGDLIEGLGLNFAEYLAQTTQAKLILIDSLDLPEKDDWEKWVAAYGEQNVTSRKIIKLQALEASGLEFVIIEADITNESQMQAAIDKSYQKFGIIHGVFYVPGISASQATFAIQGIDESGCSQQFQSIAHGLLVLEKVFQGRDIDFCLLQSSMSTLLGGLGLVAYSAGYQFVDAFAHRKNQVGSVPWFSINRQAFHPDSEKTAGLGTAATELAMTPKEVWESFELVLSMSSAGQVVVSTGDLQARLDQIIRLESLTNINTLDKPLQLHSRPNLQTTYVAPENEIEHKVVGVWQEFLGVEQVGIHDNFFELGGHSLLAVQVTSRLRENFQVELPLQSILFDAPTVAKLAAVISESQPGQIDPQEMENLLKEIRNLSPDEIQQELAADGN